MKPQTKRQIIKQDDKSQIIDKNVLFFSDRQPKQLQRKLFIANFNISSSTKLKNITRNSTQTKNKLQIGTSKSISSKHSIINSQRRESTIKINQVKQDIRQLQTRKNQMSFKNINKSSKSQKYYGQWIKPIFANNKEICQVQKQKEKLSYQKQFNDESNLFNKPQSKSIKLSGNCLVQSSQSHEKFNQQKEFLQEDQSYLRKVEDNQYFPYESNKTQNVKTSFCLQNLNLKIKNFSQKIMTQSLNYQPALQSKVTTSLNEELLKSNETVKFHEPQNIKCSFISTNKTKRNQKIYQQQPKVQRKYSKFKDLLKQQNLKKLTQQQKDISQKQKIPKNGRNSRNIKNVDLIQEKVFNQQDLQPSHFSYKSPNNYVKKYQEMTSSPLKFIKSLNDLMQGNNGYEEHEYFKYQKMQKKMMYYSSNTSKETPKKLFKQQKSVNDLEKERKVNYETFINGLKNKKVPSHGNQMISINQNKMKLTKSSNNLGQFNQEFSRKDFEEQSLSERCLKQNVFKFQSVSNDVFSKTSFEELTQKKQKQSLQGQLVNRQDYVKNKQVRLQFRKKQQKVKKLETKIERVRSLYRQFSAQNDRIDSQYSLKKALRIERSKSRNNQKKI